MSKQVLVETLSFTPTSIYLTEGKRTKNGNPLVKGILATVEVKNVNGRYYSRDLWEREIADTSQSTMRNGYSKGATLQNRVNDDSDNENSLFWNSKGTIAQGKLQHWSSDVSGAFDTDMLKDRMYVLKTNEKHNLTIGDSMVFARHSDRFRKSNVFGQDTLTTNNHYGMPSPVVGIIDEYHFVIGVTTGGPGTGWGDSGGTGSGELNQLNPHTQVVLLLPNDSLYRQVSY